MFSKKEREFLEHPENFNTNYINTLRCRIRRKIRLCLIDLNIFFQYQITMRDQKFIKIYDKLIDWIRAVISVLK